ncbi:MAG TPA: hypothetical protein VMS21_07790 [Methylomirabilota bacterium]|nr:hypothetical protein [Methylomirabilota bacterium]
MKNVKHLLALAGLTTALCLSTSQLNAQDRQGQGRGGNFDPEEFRQRMEERLREDLEVKGDDEWKVIQPRIEAVQTAQRDLAGGRAFGAFGRAGGPGGRGGDNDGPRGQGQGGRRGFGGGEPDADVQALRAAIESNASADEIKTKLAKVRESRKAKEAALEKARADLRQVLSVRQEAIAVMRGLLE